MKNKHKLSINSEQGKIKKEENTNSVKEEKMKVKIVKRILWFIPLGLLIWGGWRFYEKDVLFGAFLFLLAGILYIFKKEFFQFLKRSF